MIGPTKTWLNYKDKWGYWWIIFLREVTFEQLGGMTHDLEVLTHENRTKCNERNIMKHSLNWIQGVRWLTKMDRLEDKLKTQNVLICKCKHVPCSKVDYRALPYKQLKTIPLSFNFPTSKGECLFSFLWVQRGWQTLVEAHQVMSPFSYFSWTWESRGSFLK